MGKEDEKRKREGEEKKMNEPVRTKRSSRKSDESLVSPQALDKDSGRDETTRTSKRNRKSEETVIEGETERTSTIETVSTTRSSNRVQKDASSKESEQEAPMIKKTAKARKSEDGEEATSAAALSKKRTRGATTIDDKVQTTEHDSAIEEVAAKPIRGKVTKAAKDTATSASSSEKNSGHHGHGHHPYIEDIDLKKELIILRNPSDSVYSLGKFIISDDEGKNKFHIPEHVEIKPSGVLHLYCCAKGLDTKVLDKGEPYIFWLNKDGRNRMKNVLNDDGDKIHLMNSHEKVVATCEKTSPDADPIVVKHIVHHRGETTIRSNYSLRDGSSLDHNPSNSYVVDEKELHGDESMHKSPARGKRRRS